MTCFINKVLLISRVNSFVAGCSAKSGRAFYLLPLHFLY